MSEGGDELVQPSGQPLVGAAVVASTRSRRM